MQTKWIGCNPGNFRPGRNGGLRPEYIVIHLIDGGGLPDAWFANPAAKVSAHYGISQAGEIHQYVKEADTAWHAGITSAQAEQFPPTWKLYRLGMDVNSVTVGIEHEGWGAGHADHPASLWSDAMYAASAGLVADIAARYSIPLDRDHVIGHHEVWAGHTCPGPNCDLNRIIAEAKLVEKVSI